jgi:hypothetical protein
VNLNIRLLGAAFLVSLALSASAQPLNPAPFEINRKISLAQVAEKSRVTIDFDLREMAGAKDLLIRVYNTRHAEGSPPVHEWTFKGPIGSYRVSFNDLPIAVYRVFGTPLDVNGKPMPGGERPVYVEYGGPQAWQTHEKAPKAVQDTATEPFQKLDIGSAVEGPSVQLNPPSLVLNRGESQEIVAVLQGVPGNEPLVWKLEGKGHLKVVNNRRAVYTADKGAPIGLNATINVRSRRLQAVNASMSVVVSAIATGDIHR